MNYLINQMTEATTTIKFLSYPLLIAVFQYTGINHEAAIILAGLLIADVTTALIRVWVIDPSTFSSRVGIVGVISKCLTFCIPFVIAIVGKGAGLDMTTFVEVSMSVLIIFEGWSVLGNIGQIRKKDSTIGEYDAVSFLLRKVQSFFKAVLDNVYKS